MMPWFVPHVPERVCKYLLQRYLGQFFEEKLTLNQLSVDLYNGTGTVEKVSLDVQALNEVTEKQNWPFEVLDGYLERLQVSVPWTSILKESSFIEVHGLKLTLQPKQRKESATSMFESMWSSMTNSMQLAQECINQDATNTADSAQLMDGIEKFAQVIDSILCRVKVKFVDTVIQLEHVPQDSLTGVAIQINIDRMDYLDEAGNDPPTGEAPENSHEQSKTYIVSSFTTKTFRMEGVTFSTVEFPSVARTFSRYTMSQSDVPFEKESEDSLASLMKECEEPADGNSSGDSIEVLDDQRHVVVFGKLCAKQEIRIRMKQSEIVTGPKVSIEVNLGPLLLFLSPRQLHVLLAVANGLASPCNEDTSNATRKQKCVEKPMGALDYQRIEQELQQQLHPFASLQSAGLHGGVGWSTAGLEESDDETFLPMKNASSATMFDSALSGASSSMDSSMSSSVVSSVSEMSRFRRRVNNIESDPTAEISHFQIRLASVAAVLLHEDVLTPSTEQTETLVPSSVQQMQNTASEFFKRLGPHSFLGYSNKDFDSCRKNFESACRLNHIRIMAARVQAEGKETTTMTAFSVTGKLTVSKMQLLECLGNEKGAVEYVNLLSFEDPVGDPGETPIAANPSVKLTFKHVEKTGKNGATRRTHVPKTDVSVTLDTCTVELDVTIADRITALLHPQPVCVPSKPRSNPWGKPSGSCGSNVASESCVDVKLSSVCLTLKLRFPIPDFRPPHDMHRVPWWNRHVRQDFLALTFHDLTAETSLQSSQPVTKYSLRFAGLEASYHESECSFPLPIGKASADDGDFCKLVFERYPVKVTEDDLLQSDEPEPDVMYQSLYGSLGTENHKTASPFSSKRVVHESDTPHGKRQKEESEELIIPGDKSEIDEFVKTSTESARVRLEISLPNVTLQLVSKHVYEVIYNRINNDLLLWEPSAPKPKPQFYDRFPGGPTFDTHDTFAMCKSGIQYESESESDDESDPSVSTTVFYSLSESRARQKLQSTPVNASKRQNYMSINVHVGHGLVTLNPPVRDVALNVIPGQQAEFMLSVADANLSIINGYGGDDDLGYVCLQVHDAQLYHCDMMSVPSQTPPLKEVGSSPGRHLYPTIHRSENGVLANANNRGGNREMVSLSIRVQASHETHHVKTVRVAVGVNKATLRHRMCNEPNNWISHLSDFFNVTDYPIPGYLPKDVLTELHLHLWDCAIDYRPLYLPLRTVITLGNFSMSFHLAAQANTTTLRFIAEECALFLSDKNSSKHGVLACSPVDLRKDYVCIIDLGLFELSLRTTDKKSGINPHVDLRASNDVVHVRTCADSARALTQLLVYYASNGDLMVKDAEVSSTKSSPRHQADDPQPLVSVEPQHISNLSSSQHEQVNDLLGEAMKEIDSNEEDETLVITDTDPKIFFFPDENFTAAKKPGKPLSRVMSELGDVTYRSNKSSDTDEEFCFLGGDDPSGNILPKNGIPEIRWLTDDPLRIIDNHFSIPVGKTDILKPPKTYPQPVMRYTLREMSLIWHMYGGSDFKPPEQKQKKTVNFADLCIHDTVGYAKTHTGEVVFSDFASDKKKILPWQLKGGANRDHDVLVELQLNKLKFQHEVYPETTVQASRQVLVISELEVRDRLASSQINKFLYQYTSEARPKQSHAHMVVLKALHMRPDTKIKTEECCLKVSLLPLRLNIDQDALLFLISFFNELGGNSTPADENMSSSAAAAAAAASKHNTPTHQPPIMTVSVDSESDVQEQAQKMVGENLLLLLEENRGVQEEEISSVSSSGRNEDSPPIYFRNVLFSPEVPIRLDYQGKWVDLSHGPLPGLLMGLGQLNCSELRLRRLSNRHGILGVDKLFAYLVQEWLNDIKKNQLPSLLGGVGPMHSLVQLFQGIRDLFWMPIEQYQKDGRIVRGLQKGANSFTTSTAMAALELTSRIIHLIQITAETAYDMLSPGPSVRRLAKSKGRRKRYNQPQDIREGMANAYLLVKEGIGETADNIVRVASHEHEQKGYSGAVGGVLRQIPPTIFKPIIIGSEAMGNVLGGMRSQLVPDARREANQKWRSEEEG